MAEAVTYRQTHIKLMCIAHHAINNIES